MPIELDWEEDPLRIEAAAAAMAAEMMQHFTVPPKVQGLILRRCAEICENQDAPANEATKAMRLLAPTE